MDAIPKYAQFEIWFVWRFARNLQNTILRKMKLTRQGTLSFPLNKSRYLIISYEQNVPEYYLVLDFLCNENTNNSVLPRNNPVSLSKYVCSI